VFRPKASSIPYLGAFTLTQITINFGHKILSIGSWIYVPEKAMNSTGLDIAKLLSRNKFVR
jgi:hypothetical protein